MAITPIQAQSLFLKLIWFALTFSHLLYVATAYLLISGAPYPGSPGAAAIPLWLPALAFGLASLMTFGWSLRREKLDFLFQHYTTELALPRIFVRYIICWALNEVVTLLGFVHVFFDHDLAGILPYVGAGLLLNIIMFPRHDAAIRRAQARRDAGLVDSAPGARES